MQTNKRPIMSMTYPVCGWGWGSPQQYQPQPPDNAREQPVWDQFGNRYYNVQVFRLVEHHENNRRHLISNPDMLSRFNLGPDLIKIYLPSSCSCGYSFTLANNPYQCRNNNNYNLNEHFF